MTNPSPLAARMLRAMIEHNVSVVMTIHSHRSISGPYWVDVDNQETRLSLYDVKIQKRNIQAAEKQGWIVCYESIKDNWEGTKKHYKLTPAGRETVESLDDADFVPRKPEISHDNLKVAVKRWHDRNHPTMIYLSEFHYGGTTIDGYSISLWHSLAFRAVAYEMKASRADFLSELRNPEKRQGILQVAHQYFFVTPRKLAGPGEIPDPCGLIEIDTAGRLFRIVDSPHRNVHPPNWRYVATLLRQAKMVYQYKLDDAGRRKDRMYL